MNFMVMKHFAHSISTKQLYFNSSQFIISSMEIEKVSKRFSKSAIEMSHPISD